MPAHPALLALASLPLHALDVLLHLRWPGPHELPCNAAVQKGQELGWFEHGSTLIVFVPPGFALAEGVHTGRRLRMGEPLLRRVVAAAPSTAGHAAGAASGPA